MLLFPPSNGHRYSRRVRLSLMLTVPAIFLTACGKPTAETGKIPADIDSNVIATVNGVAIDRDQMYAEMEQYVPAQIQNFPRNPLLGLPAGRVALQHLINNELTMELAKSEQVPVTDDEVASRYADVKMVKESESFNAFEDLLKDQGLTVEQFEDQSIKPYVAQFNIISKGVNASDQELMANYNQHISDYTEPNRVHLERIVLPDEATAEHAYETASKDNSLDEVMTLNIAQPLNGGMDAADIPQWISLDQAAPALRPVLQEAQIAQPGTVLKPMLVGTQWWLVKVIDHKPKCVLPYSQVKHMVDWNVITGKATIAGNFQKMQSAMQDMTQDAVIHVQPQYASMVVQLKSPPAPYEEPMQPTQSAN